MFDLNKVWGGPLSGNSFVVVVINRFDVEKQILMNWSEDAKVPAGVYSVQVRDVSFHQGSLIRLVTLDALQCTENVVFLA